MTDIRQKMSTRHEDDIAELFKMFGGHKSKASGATDSAKNDGRTDHFGRWNFSWDCKATLGQSIAVSRALVGKLMQDATGDRPVLPLRIYANEQLDTVPGCDVVAFQIEDVREMLEALAELEQLQARVAQSVIVNVPDHLSEGQLAEFAQQLDAALASGVPQFKQPSDPPQEGATFEAMSAALMAAQDQLANMEGKLAQMREERDDALKSQAPAQGGRLAEELAEATRDRAGLREENELLTRRLGGASQLIKQHTATIRQYEQTTPGVVADGQEPVDIPRTDPNSASGIGSQGWLIVQQVKLPGGQVRNVATWWDRDGHSHPHPVNEVRIEPVSPTEERLVVNNRRVPAGDLYIAGKRRLRVGA